MKKRFWAQSLLGAVFLTTMVVGCGQASAPSNDKQPAPASPPQQAQPTPAKQYAAPPKMALDQTKQYFATLKTNKGDIEIELFNKQAPITVNNFVFLSKDHYYDGVKFHRIVKDFMIQTGDPTATGAGGPGYTFKDELPPVKPYAPGIVAMANRGPNTNGSQFFIGSGNQVNQLNNMPNYTVFGEVVKGMDVVQAIANTPVEMSAGGEASKPKEDIHIDTVTITEK